MTFPRGTRSKLPYKRRLKSRGSLGRIKRPGAKSALPKWLKSVPEGRHGSGTLQKRLWRLKSDFVRIRDWIEFGTFIDSGEPIYHWNDAQAGHWRSYAECRGMFKFHEMNIHAQSPKGNSWPTSTTWENYRKNLVKRYGEEFVLQIDKTNKNWPLKITNDSVLREIEGTIQMLKMLSSKPPYWPRLMKLREMDGVDKVLA